MKVLLVSTVLHKGVIGPAKFARFLSASDRLDVDVVVENEQPADGVITFPLKQGYLKRKLSLYSRVSPYKAEIQQVANHYDVVLYSSTVLAYDLPQTTALPVVMINDDNYLSAKPSLSKLAVINSFYKRIERSIVGKVPLVIVNSDYLKDAVIRTYNCSPDKVEVLYKATDVDSIPFTPPRQLTHSSPIKVLFVKNDYVRGGLLDLIDALSTLGEYEWELTVVGCTPSLPEVKHVTYQIKGGLPHQSVLELMQSHDIYCVPSRREALGVANMEAMACGIPVVTTDAGGIPEVITAREGWIAKPQDPVSLAAVIADCVGQPQLRVRKAELAREKVKQFSVDRMMERLLAILKKAVSQHQ